MASFFRSQHPTLDTYDLSALISSRICHDLINPIGAIGNVVELISGQSANSVSEFEAIAAAARAASAKLRYFRSAFGPSGAGGSVAVAEIETICADMYGATRLLLRFELSSQVVSMAEAKALYLLLLCAQTGLPKGGLAIVGPSNVTMHGQLGQDQVGLWGHLQGGDARTTLLPSTVHFALARKHLEKERWLLKITNSENERCLSFGARR